VRADIARQSASSAPANKQNETSKQLLIGCCLLGWIPLFAGTRDGATGAAREIVYNMK
jgi:hypothetical protein